MARADSLHDRIQQANGLLRSGEVDQALDAYHDIQVDHPDSPVLDYNIGCAEYDKGVKALGSGEKKSDSVPLSEAIASFDRAIQSGDPAVSGSAAFNRANCLAQTAKNAGAGADQAGRTKAFYDAIRAYEDVLKAEPENAGAKQNIDHLRYMMKKASPPPPPQEGGESSKPQENQGGENQDQQQPQDGQSDQQNEQQQQQQEQQQNDRQQQNADQSEQKDQQKEQQNPSEPSPNDQQDAGASEQDQDHQEPTDGTPDRQTVEALLQSLENQDNEMQKELRQGARTARVRPSGWW